jgi:hypothetical protein
MFVHDNQNVHYHENGITFHDEYAFLKEEVTMARREKNIYFHH